MIYKELTKSDFIKEFDDNYSFSNDGLGILYDYLIENEVDITLDVSELSKEYIEYEDLEAFNDEYDKEYYPDIEAIENETNVIMINDESFIISNF